TEASLAIPLLLQVGSDATGELLVTAEDEYTYYAEGSPRLAGAAVVVTDLVRARVVTNAVNAADGRLSLPGLPANYYRGAVTAEQHTPSEQVVYVPPGRQTNVLAFLSRQTVRYVFRVVPATVEERAHIRLETVFEAFVPIPVV